MVRTGGQMVGGLGSGRLSRVGGVAIMIAAAVLTGGIAIAGSTSAGRTIHACVSKSTGVVRIAAHCRSDETGLSWNRQGAAGPAGLRGETGPSDAYAVYSGISFGVDVPTTMTPIGPALTLPAPPGGASYVVSAEVLMNGSSNRGVEVLCELVVGDGTTIPGLDAAFETFLPDPSGVSGQDRVVPLAASGTVYGTTTAHVQCLASPELGGTDTVFVSSVRITAVKAGTLNVSVVG